MQIKKWIATGLSALMAGATLAGAGLAATQLGSFPTFLGQTSASGSALDAFVVVGADAKPSDVVGAVDLAARLAELSYTTETIAGTTTVAGTFDKDGLSIGVASGGDRLSVGGTDYSNAFPAGAVVKNFHWAGLKDSTFPWKSANYDFSEQIYLGGVLMRHDYGTSGVNGTLTMEVESGDVIYQYVFDKELSGTGDDSNKNYTYPVNIELLGKAFSIIGTNTDKAVMLSGSVGTADATKGVTHGDYTAYATLGSNDKWAKIVIQDKSGTTVDTLVVNEGDIKTSTATKLDVQVTDARALADGTVVGVDLVLGPQGLTEKTYDTSADTTSTGSASDRFPGTTDWGIRVAGSNFTNANRGKLAANAIVEVIYQPTSKQYVKAGGVVKIPNDYGEVKLVGYGTSKLATVTVEPVTSQSAYNSTGDQVGSNLNGLKISSVDENGAKLSSIVANNGNAYSEAYVLFGKQIGAGVDQPYPVFFGFWDTTNSRVKLADLNASAGGSAGTTNPSTSTLGSGAGQRNVTAVTSEYAWLTLNGTQNISYSYRLSYGGSGEKSDWRLNFTIFTPLYQAIGTAALGFPTFDGSTIFGASFANNRVSVGDPANFNVRFAFQNKTVWNAGTVPEFRLGGTAASSEAGDVNATTETGANSVGKSSQDVLDDNGVILVAPDANAAADKVKFKVAAKELTARVTVGKETPSTTAGTTVNKVAPITSAVAKLDTEVGLAEKAKDLVLVGGPCVNKLTAEALGKTYPACGANSGIASNTALVQVFDDSFAKGAQALVVAGWEADNTRLATSVLQQYDKYLKGVTASKVTVTGTVAAPVVTPS